MLREMIPAEHLVRIYHEQLGLDVSDHFADVPVVRVMVCRECGLLFFFPAVTGSAAFYQALSDTERYYMTDKWEFSEGSRLIGPADRVLEVGCGRGLFAARLTCGGYVGLDTSPSAVSQGGGLDLRNELVEDHAVSTPGGYDVVCGFQVLEHVADPARFLEACVACLRPGGRLLLSTPNPDSFLGLVVNDGLNLPPHHVTHWPKEAWESLERLLPLTLEQLVYEPLQDYHHKHYAHTVAVALARQLGGLTRASLVDYSSKHLQAVELARGMKAQALAVFADARLRPQRGHSVLAVLRKADA